MDLPDKIGGGFNEEVKSSPVENPDSIFFENKDYQRDQHKSDLLNDGMQFYLDQEYPVSPAMPVGIENEGLQYPIMKSSSADLPSPVKNYGEPFLLVEPGLNNDDVQSSFLDCDNEERRLSVEDYESNDKNEGTEDAKHNSHPGFFLDDNVNETYSNEFHTEVSYSYAHNSLLTGDNNNCYEITGDEPVNFHQTVKSPVLIEAENADLENASLVIHSEKLDVLGEMDGGLPTEMKEDDCFSVKAASENKGMVWENSSLHSPQRTQNASRSPERQFSISAERSPHSHQSPHIHSSSRQELPPPVYVDKKTAPSTKSSRRKRSPSPVKHSGRHRRPSSRKHSPTRKNSPSERTTKRDTHRRDGSPRRHIAPSPRRRESPRRRGRSKSRSPGRRRDSPGRRKDHHRRSRSRSPYARDRSRRSPRRRPSPRRRSPPPSHSRRRSPRRPWSPPANRNTGLGKPGNNLFIAGFSYATSERDLEKKFSKFGRVTDVRIVRDRRSGESRGFGFLSLERDEDADAAIRAVDQTEWNGRIILVEKSKTATR